MIVYFFEPPMRQKVGGLDLAVRTLRAYLLAAGATVKNESEFPSDGTSVPNETLVHFHGLWQPQFLKASQRSRARNIPYVVSPHGMLEPWAWKHKRWKKLPYFLLFERNHLLRAASLLATSDMEAGNLRKFFPRARCPVIPLGLTDKRGPDYAAARKRLGWHDEKVLLFLSRIHPKKGLDFLLNSLADLEPGTKTGLRLVIVGGGEAAYVNGLRAMTEQRKTQLPKIDWMGEIWGEEKWSFLQGADLFCLPSFSENFGLAVLEALQVGTRVLTTNTVPWQFLSDWNAGFIVEPDTGAVREGLQTFLKNSRWTDEQRAALANRIRQRFGWETVGPEYLKVYESVIGDGR
jgi:glycosyltransferase involved in cell wall biosynthesis